MQLLRFVPHLALALLTACSSTPIDPQNVTIVTARSVERGKGVSGITDSFTFEGPIYVFATMTWDTSTSAGTKAFEARWFNGEKLKLKQTGSMNLERPPWHVYFKVTGAALGTGDCRVEIYADNVPLGYREFRVREK